MTDEGDDGDEPVGPPGSSDPGPDDATSEDADPHDDTPDDDTPGDATPDAVESVEADAADADPEDATVADSGPEDAGSGDAATGDPGDDRPSDVPPGGDASREATPTPTEETDATDSTAQSPADDPSTSDVGREAEPGDSPAEESPTAATRAAETQADAAGPDPSAAEDGTPSHSPGVPEDVRTYDRFQKIDGSTYERANDFLRERTYVTAREWAIARLCADFRTETGVEMTKIGDHLPQLVPFMTDTYSPQAVNQARAAFEEKVRKAGATFLYGAMSDFFTAEELDDVMYEATEVAKFLLEVEGVDLTVEEELEAEDKISEVMREVREHSAALRHDEVACPECGHYIEAEDV